ncbi:MAG: tRNA (N6-threonylcarbamoyladenosine(37)-N6)-methyltransferase TrmO [Candidatus Marinimicrobia bacterium]|nr:tRNA (N6-threonylcarbamoyladenosine(37)-N6)-methyltransferase TrmO [Candidatus Neomarinimicrobiota bacterium]
MTIQFSPIGIIHSPFKKPEGMPIQPEGAKGTRGQVEIFSEFVDGLIDLERFSHITLLYHFHLSDGYNLTPIPFLDNVPHGVFSTRAPRRPNAIGMSTVKLMSIQDNILHIENIDIVDGTPLIDIKPFFPDIDSPESVRTGWAEDVLKKMKYHKSDNRFK